MAKVLVLEDEEQFAAAVERTLHGHQVVRVDSVDGAIHELSQGDIDCALIDLNLTDRDDNAGMEVLTYMRGGDVPRAVVTGSHLKGGLRGGIMINLMLRYGVSEVVLKGDVDKVGFATTDILEAVEMMLTGSGSSRLALAEETIREAADKVTRPLLERGDILRRAPGLRRQGRVGPGIRALEAAIAAVEKDTELALAALRESDVSGYRWIVDNFVADIGNRGSSA